MELIDGYKPKIGEYVKHRFDEDIKGIVENYDLSGNMCNIKLHNTDRVLLIFKGNLEKDIQMYRNNKIDELL